MHHPTHTKQSGFTLIEVLLVITLIAILSGIVYVTFKNAVRGSLDASLKYDISQMNSAQKRYMSLTNQGPVSYTSDNGSGTTLSFASSKGNSIVVTLVDDTTYCIYGYNSGSSYPSIDQALVYSSNSGSVCPQLTNGAVSNTAVVRSTVEIIGQRLEEFYSQYGFYPHLTELTDVGLTIKPNSANANQQQLYCRNDTKAIYAQIDTSNNLLYVYDTATKTVIESNTADKVTTSSICPEYTIQESDAGYQSTGVKDPTI